MLHESCLGAAFIDFILPFNTIYYSTRVQYRNTVLEYCKTKSASVPSRGTLAEQTQQPTLESVTHHGCYRVQCVLYGTEYTPRTPHNVFYAPPPPHSTSRTSLFSHFCWCPITDADPLESLVRRAPLSRSPDEEELGSAPNQAR